MKRSDKNKYVNYLLCWATVVPIKATRRNNTRSILNRVMYQVKKNVTGSALQKKKTDVKSRDLLA